MLRRIITIAILIGTMPVGQAADEITDPVADPTELWHYGSGSNNQTVTFSYDTGTTLSSFTMKIVVKDSPSDELYSQAWYPPFTNPCTENITVPDPIADTENCTLKVTLQPMSMDPPTTISQDVNITKP